MNGIRKQLAVCLTMLSLGIGAAEIPWFNQDFENREFFTPQAVKNGQSASAGQHTGFAMPHAKIVDLNGSQAFRLERIGSHRAFKFSGLTPMPEGRDFSVDFDVMLPEGGGTYIFLWDKADRKLIGVSFHNNEVINITDEAELWVKLDITMPGGVSHFKFKGFISDGTCQVVITTPDGKTKTSKKMPMGNIGMPAMLEFGTIPTQGSAAVIDNLKISYSDHRDISFRNNAATKAQTSTQGFEGTPGDLTLQTNPGRVNFELAKMSDIASIRIAAPDHMIFKVIGINNGGQRVDLAENRHFVKITSGVRQVDFKPVTLRSVYIAFAGKPGDKVGDIALYEDKIMSQLNLDDIFCKEVYGEFALPVYEGRGNADLHLFNETKDDIPIEAVLKGQTDKKVYAKIAQTLKPGKNSVNFDLSELEAGYYVAEVIDNREPDAIARGRFRRLLRRQVLPEPEASEATFIAGQKLFFPDNYYLESSQNLDFRTTQSETHKISADTNSPDIHAKIGLGLAVVDGKLVAPYQTMDNYFRNSSARRFMATADFGDLDNWEIKEITMGTTLPKFKQEVAEDVSAGDWEPKPGNDGKINYQFYDPEKDGPVDVKQIQFRYVHWMAAGTLGGEEQPVWGDFTPERRTTWPIWFKAPGEARILTREPIFTDNRSTGEFEVAADSNDNFCGQWLSDDGKYVYYCRGHIIRRYPPYNVSYDNLPNGLRLLTIIRTCDGINFERSFVSVPGRDEPLQGTQHYGGVQYRMRQGNGLRILFILRYFAHEQRMFVETSYSWDGFNWKRFAGQKPLADNPPPPHWMCAGTSLGISSVITNGKVYYLLNMTGDAYHIMSELIWDRDFKSLNGQFCQSYMQPRGFDKWPMWKYFRDYDHIAEHLKKSQVTTGLMVWREDGLFYLEAKDTPGVFVTKALSAGNRMGVNLELEENGRAVFTLLDEQNRPIPGYTKTVSGKTDEIDLEIFKDLPLGIFKVKGEITNGKLCTLTF